jgi:hypothetical protein
LVLPLWFLNASADDTDSSSNKPSRLNTLVTLQEVRKNLTEEIKLKASELKASLTDSDKTLISFELDQLSNDLADIDKNFEQISTGLNSELNNDKPKQKFDLKNDLGALIQPIVKEMKHATSGIRQKTQLRDELAFYEEKVLHAGAAVENLEKLIRQAKTDKKKVHKSLKKLHENGHDGLNKQQATTVQPNYNSRRWKKKVRKKAFSLIARNI